MSLNAKGDKPEPPVEKRLADLERQLKKTRGANRRKAFVLLREADEKRALEVLEEMTEAASGKTKAELGTLLLSTGSERFIERALRGKWGDVLVAGAAPLDVVQDHIARMEAGYSRLSPADIERRARALGLVPFDPRIELRAGQAGPRVLVKILDDTRLPKDARLAAARALAAVEPWTLWARREELPVELSVAAGLAAGVAVPSPVESAHFAAAVRALTADEKHATLVLAKLPVSAARLPPESRVSLLALILDDEQALPADRALAGKWLVDLAHADANEAILARPHAAPAATVDVCRRLDVEEARAVLAPLLAKDADARIAFANSASVTMADAFLGEAASLLAADPLAAAAILARAGDLRATEELLDAVDVADADAARAMLCGAMWIPVPGDARATAARTSFHDVVANVSIVQRARRPLVMAMLERMRTKPGFRTIEVDTALDVLRRAP